MLNTKLVQIEKQATLLVNPRFSCELYTKYSFPSKILEYMSTGTPVLTTKLEGIPDEYSDFLYFFEDESVKGMKDKLNEILSFSYEQLQQKGEDAQLYVFKNKNNVVQGLRIIQFTKEVLI